MTGVNPEQGIGIVSISSGLRVKAVITQLLGAFIRAVLVALLIALPSIILPGSVQDAQEGAMAFALVAAAITLVEYGASHPGLIQFRFAPPFNRLRFLSIMLTVILLSYMCRGMVLPTGFTTTIAAIGDTIGMAMDFPLSPVRIITDQLTVGALPEQVNLIRAAAGISYITSLVMLAVFVVFIRLFNWPVGNGTFNLWINLPTYDWSSNKDVEGRLSRDARVNLVFGFALPFLIPLVASTMRGIYEIEPASNHQALVWTMAIWAFLPASLFMRGIAMQRIAVLIRRKREHLHQPSVSDFAAA